MKNLFRPIAIFIDNRVCVAPFVNEKITGKFELADNFIREEASQVVDILTSGVLTIDLIFSGN